MAQTKATEKPQADAPQPTSAEETARREVRILDNEMAGEVQAHIVRMVQSGAETITGSEVTLQQSAAQAIRGLNNSQALAVIGQHVDVTRGRTVLLLGREVQGQVDTVLDHRSALLLGLGIGVGLGLLSLIKALLFRRRSE